jgi:lipid-A-disaccharide synthase
LVALLPGSRKGEVSRHLPILLETADRIAKAGLEPLPKFILAVPPGLNLKEPISGSSIQLLEGQTWDVLACSDLALAASGTVTIEASLLGTPMITFYRVNKLSWWMGRYLVKVPFYSMVNLVAGRRIVREFIQNEMTGARLAEEALRLLGDDTARQEMRREMALVVQKLSRPDDPMEVAAAVVEKHLKEEMVHV